MTLRLHLLCAASTPSTRSVAFPSDEKLDAQGREALARLSGRLPSCEKIWRSPALSAAETADGLCLDAKVEPMLRDCDFGRWAGRNFENIQAQEPVALADWLSDPNAAPHGGESFAAVMTRVGGWMEDLVATSGVVLAVTHATIVRAAIAHALGVGPEVFRHLDVPPLSRVKLSSDGRRWTLAALVPLKETA